MDGIKTGYIRASGFNLAASAVRDGRRLIGVVMGGDSAHSRDMKMASLLNEASTAVPRRAMRQPTIAEDEPANRSYAARARPPRRSRTLAQLSPISQAEAATPRPGRRRLEHPGRRLRAA